MEPDGRAVPFQFPRGSISQPVTSSSIQEEVPRDGTTDTSIWTGDRGKNLYIGPSAGRERRKNEAMTNWGTIN
jgi:hypothetical protein